MSSGSTTARYAVTVTAPPTAPASAAVYAEGTSTAAVAYTTETGATTVTQPVALAASGSQTFWLPERVVDVSVVVDGVELAGGYGVRKRVVANGQVKVALGVDDVPASLGSTEAVTLTGTADPYGSGVVDLTAADGGFEINHGSTGTPVTTIGPNLRSTRVEALAAATGGGTNLMNEKNAAGVFIATGQGNGTPGDNMQTNAVFAFAKASGSAVWDAVAINAVGKSTSVNTRRGTAAYLEGLKDNTTGLIIACEIRSNNQVTSSEATDDDYSTGGASNTLGLWVACSSHASANQVHGAGIQLGRTGTAQWGVGIGITSSSIQDQSIRDDSSSVTSIMVNGSHTYGLDLNGGTFSGAAIRLANAMPLKWRNAAGNADYDAILLNSSNELAFGVSASQVVSMRFHRSLVMNDSANIALGTSTGTKIGSATNQKLGFYNATPIIQPAGIGAAATDAATTQTLANNLRTALINLGLVAA